MPSKTLRPKKPPTPQRWTPALAAGLAERRLAGESLQDIGDDYGVSRERIRQVLVKHNLDHIKPPSQPTSVTRTCRVCTSPYIGTYRDHVKAVKHPYHSSSWHVVHAAYVYDEQVVAMYTAGDRLAEISKACEGLTFFSIYRILRRHGIEPNRGGGQYKRDHERLRALAKARAAGVSFTRSTGWRAK